MPLPYVIAAAGILSPFAVLVWMRLAREKDMAGRLLNFSTAIAFTLFVFLIGPWALLSHYLRYAALALFLAAAPYARLRRLPLYTGRNPGEMLSSGVKTVLLLIFLFLDYQSISGLFYRGGAVDLAFPLSNGKYLVIQGGSSTVANYFHSVNPAQRYALDIVKLDPFGRRADRLFTEELSGYKVFGEPLASPCNGTIIKAVDGISDNIPPSIAIDKPEGNHVIIKCKGIELILAHLMKGSVIVREGDAVEEGSYIGRAGNSGNSLEPHLHIHAVKEGTQEAAPLVFKGRFLSINSVISS